MEKRSSLAQGQFIFKIVRSLNEQLSLEDTVEKKLHPNLSAQFVEFKSKAAPQGKIQNEFDPTPTSWLGTDPAEGARTAGAKGVAEQQEFMGEAKLKLNRTVQKLANMEERLETLGTEMRTNYSKLSGKVSEKAVSETRLESFMEKHNSVIQNFERKMAQMTKLLEDYQNKIMISNAVLEDARREIAKLKRM